jgi:Mrp family chromosome partitioning ATPase
VLVSSPDQVTQGLPAALPISDVVYCVRTGQTQISELKKAIEEIEQAGGRVRGIVLWNALDPELTTLPRARQPARKTASV